MSPIASAIWSLTSPPAVVARASWSGGRRWPAPRWRAIATPSTGAVPVPGFGDPGARLLLVGLAPAAHGANRTGRVFTGDNAGGSGELLFEALHRAGYSPRARSVEPRR